MESILPVQQWQRICVFLRLVPIHRRRCAARRRRIGSEENSQPWESLISEKEVFVINNKMFIAYHNNIWKRQTGRLVDRAHPRSSPNRKGRFYRTNYWLKYIGRHRRRRLSRYLKGKFRPERKLPRATYCCSTAYTLCTSSFSNRTGWYLELKIVDKISLRLNFPTCRRNRFHNLEDIPNRRTCLYGSTSRARWRHR